MALYILQQRSAFGSGRSASIGNVEKGTDLGLIHCARRLALETYRCFPRRQGLYFCGLMERAVRLCTEGEGSEGGGC